MIIKPIVFLSCRRRSSVLKLPINKSVSDNDGDNNENVKKQKKEIGLLSKTTTLHVHHAFSLLHDCDVKNA